MILIDEKHRVNAIWIYLTMMYVTRTAIQRHAIGTRVNVILKTVSIVITRDV